MRDLISFDSSEFYSKVFFSGERAKGFLRYNLWVALKGLDEVNWWKFECFQLIDKNYPFLILV